MIFDFIKGFNGSELHCYGLIPIIAVSANIMNENSALHFAYSQAIVDAGAIPVIIPANCNTVSLHSLMSSVDGVLLSGGDDIDGAYFGEENIPQLTELNAQRDYYEFAMLRTALDHGLPILGICRGAQVINVALGGTIYQDLPSMYTLGELLRHSILTDKHLAVHDINITEGSTLWTILGTTKLGVNSRHHQAIKDVAPSLIAVAHSGDGVVEGVESRTSQKIVALQCHPENMATTAKSVEMQRLFAHFIHEAKLYKKAKEIHARNPIVDSHCDTPMLYDEGDFDFGIRNAKACVDVVKMAEGRLDGTITVAYIPQTTPPSEATGKALDILYRFRTDIEALSDRVVIVNSPEELMAAKTKGLRGVMLGIENGIAIGKNLETLDLFKQEGVVYITLCHNGSNQICDSARGARPHGGVSQFGEAVIKRMNALGITVDVSHSSEESTLDAVRLSDQPIIASHSSCKALYDHPRNLSDDAIRAIAQRGGVVQVCGYGGFLRSDSSEASLNDILDHVEHIIELVGYDHVGIGSDFDGGGGVADFEGANHFMNVTIELLRREHKEAEIAKIMGGNILRVISNNFKHNTL